MVPVLVNIIISKSIGIEKMRVLTILLIFVSGEGITYSGHGKKWRSVENDKEKSILDI